MPGLVTQLRYEAPADLQVEHAIKSTVINIRVIDAVYLTLFFPMFPLIPLKTSENLWFSDVFMGIKREHWEEKG